MPPLARADIFDTGSLAHRWAMKLGWNGAVLLAQAALKCKWSVAFPRHIVLLAFRPLNSLKVLPRNDSTSGFLYLFLKKKLMSGLLSFYSAFYISLSLNWITLQHDSVCPWHCPSALACLPYSPWLFYYVTIWWLSFLFFDLQFLLLTASNSKMRKTRLVTRFCNAWVKCI